MKKHKSVVAILLSVMMIFTMMPMMAFAAEAQSWGAEFATVTDKDGVTFNTERVFDGSYSATGIGTGSGVITATPLNNKSGVIGQSDVIAPTEKKYYYNLDGSEFVYNNAALNGTTWTQEKFEEIFPIAADGTVSGLTVKLVEPSYAAGYKATEVKTAAVTGFTAWEMVVKASEYKSGSEKDQTVTLSATITANPEAGQVIDGSEGRPDLFGKVADATVTVKGLDKTPNTADFYFDSVGGVKWNKTTGSLSTYYDGSAHTVVCDTVPGWTVSYEVYNEATGRYASVNAISITDAQDPTKPIKARATFAKSGQTSVQKDLYVNLEAAGYAIVSFDKEQSITDYGIVYSVPGTEYDTAKYIVVEPSVEEYTGQGKEPAADRASREARNAATKKAVEANKATILAWFNDYCEVTAKATKDNPEVVRLQIAKKALTAEEETALEKKYEGFVLNVGEPEPTVGRTAEIYLNGGVFDYEVEFTKAPAGKVIYKGSKTTKAGKLKKNQTITVKAIARNGAAVKYKLVNANSKITIDKNTGKITVKKGLKKGTYTFKVKAYIPGVVADGDVTGFYEYQTIKIQLKK